MKQRLAEVKNAIFVFPRFAR